MTKTNIQGAIISWYKHRDSYSIWKKFNYMYMWPYLGQPSIRKDNTKALSLEKCIATRCQCVVKALHFVVNALCHDFIPLGLVVNTLGLVVKPLWIAVNALCFMVSTLLSGFGFITLKQIKFHSWIHATQWKLPKPPWLYWFALRNSISWAPEGFVR